MAAERKRTAKGTPGVVRREGSGKKRDGSLADFFAKSPLRGARIDLTRLPDQPREIDLGEGKPLDTAEA